MTADDHLWLLMITNVFQWPPMASDNHRWLLMHTDGCQWLVTTTDGCRWPADVHQCLLMTTNENWWCECLLILRLKFCLSIPRCALMHRYFDVISQIPCFWLQDTPLLVIVYFICFIWYFNENLCGLDQYFTFKVLFQCELTDSICDTSPLFPGSWFVNVSHMSSSYWLMETADANSSHQWFHHITCSVDDCRKLSINFLTLWQPASGEESVLLTVQYQ